MGAEPNEAWPVETNLSDFLKIPSKSFRPGRKFWEHACESHNIGACTAPSARAVGVGSCGDKIRVDLCVVADMLQEVKCIPQGCVYTLACASAMSVLATGRSLEAALQLQPEDVVNELDGLPEDHWHCARLAVNTLGDAISEYYRLLNPSMAGDQSVGTPDRQGDT